jgi:predicted ATP-binding protein involved in virulence
MAYWQVREDFNYKNIDNSDKIQVDDLLFLAHEGVIISYARCVKNIAEGIEVDKWTDIPSKPALLPASLERGQYSQKIALIKNNDKISELLSLLIDLKVYKLKKMKLTNFRLFEKLEIEFNEDINVIIANNGAGKTSVLDAIALGFGTMLTHLPNVNGIGFSKDKRDLKINDRNKKEPYLRIELTSTQNIKWDRIDKRDKSKTTAKQVPNGYGLKELEIFMDTIIDAENEGNNYIMPLIMYYGTCRNCFDAPLRKVNFQKEFNRFEALSGSLKGTSNFSRLFQWFNAMENLERKEIQNRRDFDYQLPELKNVREAITSMLKGFQNPRIKNRPLRFMIDRVETDGSTTELQIEQLSAGYKAVLAIIMDISARMSEANPHLGNKSEAIILIDELDLHLHPKWQQTILSDLRQTFPNAQFIITTHSPQILTTVKKEQVFILEDNQIKKPFDTAYAKRSIVALEDLMGTDSMPPLEEVDLLDKYLEKIHQGDIDSEEVLKFRKQLNELYGKEYQQLKIADMIINKYLALRNN